MRSHVKASFAASGSRSARLGLVGIAVLSLVAFLGIGAPSASAVDTCPNVVFRTGPSAKLPDCRAYELVTPNYSGGHAPTYEAFLNDFHGMFATDTVTPAGDSVVYHTVGGGLSGFPASGYVDRYRARRTAVGWATEPISPGGEESSGGGPGGISSDHEYSVSLAGDITAKLDPTLAGQSSVEVLRTPDGYEALGKGSLGEAYGPHGAIANWISAGAAHVLFTSSTKLEPNAPGPGVETIYDRSPGGPTHVVSLLPGDVTPAQSSDYLGATKDGTEVAFEPHGGGELYVRRNNSVTEEVFRIQSVFKGKQLTCKGEPENATLEYQWLRNGVEIDGATSPTYTVAADDAGSVVQCRVTASNAEGKTIRTSATRVVDPYQGKSLPAMGFGPLVNSGTGDAATGTELSCDGLGGWGSGAGVSFAYQWLRDGSEIGGATSSTYTPVEADVGKSLQCRVTASTSEGISVGYSQKIAIHRAAPRASSVPEISDETASGDLTPAVGDELSCSEGTWSGSPSVTYQWLRDGTEIATGDTYTTTAADEETTLQCQVEATNAGGSTQAVSEAVLVEPQPATAPPKQTFPGGVFGTAKVGETLFCGPGIWEGEPSFAYQWLRNGTEISGSSNEHTLTAQDREAVLQCRVTATNGGGSVVTIDANQGAKLVLPAAPDADAFVPSSGFTFNGIFGGRVFYSDVTSNFGGKYWSDFGDLYVYDLDEEKTTRITGSGDSSIVNVSDDGSHVYFVSYSQIDGEGDVGKPNLGVWTVGEGAKFIATVAEADVKSSGANETASINTWAVAMSPNVTLSRGWGMDHTRSTSDGSVFAFESTAQITAFDNTEASAADCGETGESGQPIAGQPCDEVYRYDATNGELSCVSCGSELGPARGNARLQSLAFGGAGNSGVAPATVNSPVESLTTDGETVFFESTEGIVPQDGNETKDVYRWTKGKGAALISTGQDSGDSALYGVTADGANVIFATRQRLLPQDENGSTVRLYDARVNGGFPPPEETVTEPCAGDVCQGQADAALSPPNVASASLNGGGNVAAKLKCRKHMRRMVRKGAERCIQRKKKHHAHHRQGNRYRRASR